MANIFADDNKVKGNWWKYTTIGDKIQGTYIGKRQIVNQLSGQEQWIYEIRDDNKAYWNIGGKPGIDMQMKHINPGQIIGFEFVEERPNPKPGMNDTKVVQVYANDDVIDETFSAEEEAQKQADMAANATPATTVTATATTEAVVSTDDKIASIMEIAKVKWSLTDATQVKQKVMEETNMAFIESNLDKIIEAIK